ncbi:hypothetical protein [Algirhabdus cladophorae]|uniref:hypothetical protein n=1 Tax=Algirhabdus cladophorae TaxID=3377108 RepID=UPI003B84821C
MDYKAAGAPKGPKGSPRHQEHNSFGTKNKPFGAKDDKAALLARMKANAEKSKKAE